MQPPRSLALCLIPLFPWFCPLSDLPALLAAAESDEKQATDGLVAYYHELFTGHHDCLRVRPKLADSSKDSPDLFLLHLELLRVCVLDWLHRKTARYRVHDLHVLCQGHYLWSNAYYHHLSSGSRLAGNLLCQVLSRRRHHIAQGLHESHILHYHLPDVPIDYELNVLPVQLLHSGWRRQVVLFKAWLRSQMPDEAAYLDVSRDRTAIHGLLGACSPCLHVQEII